jgi:hypothetical protein
MIYLTQTEWVGLFGLFVMIVGILYIRSMKKRKSQQKRQEVARELYQKSVLAQSEAVTGVQEPSPIVKMAQRILPLDIDPDTQYVQAAIGMNQNRQDFYRQAYEASMNNEFLQM